MARRCPARLCLASGLIGHLLFSRKLLLHSIQTVPQRVGTAALGGDGSFGPVSPDHGLRREDRGALRAGRRSGMSAVREPATAGRSHRS